MWKHQTPRCLILQAFVAVVQPGGVIEKGSKKSKQEIDPVLQYPPYIHKLALFLCSPLILRGEHRNQVKFGVRN